jgi:hypothetical protein
MSWRQIEIDGKKYRWRGQQYFIVQDANGKRVIGAYGHEIKGMSVYDWDRARHKRYASVTPRDIVDLIRGIAQ